MAVSSQPDSCSRSINVSPTRTTRSPSCNSNFGWARASGAESETNKRPNTNLCMQTEVRYKTGLRPVTQEKKRFRLKKKRGILYWRRRESGEDQGSSVAPDADSVWNRFRHRAIFRVLRLASRDRGGRNGGRSFFLRFPKHRVGQLPIFPFGTARTLAGRQGRQPGGRAGRLEFAPSDAVFVGKGIKRSARGQAVHFSFHFRLGAGGGLWVAGAFRGCRSLFSFPDGVEPQAGPGPIFHFQPDRQPSRLGLAGKGPCLSRLLLGRRNALEPRPLDRRGERP